MIGSKISCIAGVLVLAGCWGATDRSLGVGGAGGVASSGGGASGAGGGAGAGAAAARPVAPSGLPYPPGGGVPRPSGAPRNLTVLPWAAFKAAATWTFDDSQPSQIAHYAELAAVGIPMTFYISTGNSSEAGYDATWAQAVHDGSEIGNHTVHHCHADLSRCSFGTADPVLDSEIDECSSYITAHYPQAAVWTAASPFGDTGYDALDGTRFLVNRGVGDGLIGPDADVDPFNLPIHLAQPSETAAAFEAVTDAARAGGAWIIFLVHSITPTSATWYNPVAIGDVTGAMSYGVSVGDVWNDSVVNVAAYWRARKLVAAAVPVPASEGTTWSWTLPPHFPPGRYLRVTVDGGTLSQGNGPLAWDDHGFYEVALDAGALSLGP
jgi:peptidoglycan/xylan/chitin deacetylase (PgdA/CDA1 family)